MDDDIQLKRSNVPGLVPAAGELLDGELAINTADKKLYAKSAQGQVVVLNPAAPVQSIASSSTALTVSDAAGAVTLGLAIEPTPQQQADWAVQDTAAASFIKNKPTALSAFSNDKGFVDAAGASAAAPIQSIASSSTALTVSGSGGAVTLGLSIEPQAQVQANWNEANNQSAAFIQNKPTALSKFTNDALYVDAAGAAAAAPVQSILAGTNVSITSANGVFTVASSKNPGTVTEVQVAAPLSVENSTSVPSISIDDATTSSRGAVRLATAQEISAATPGVVVDAQQLSQGLQSVTSAIPSKVSQLTNDAQYITSASLVSYLPLSGGTVTGLLRAPTGPPSDSSTLVATTEWVKRELESSGKLYSVWLFGGADTASNPGGGFLRLSSNGQFLAISKYALSGLVSVPTSLQEGDVVELREAPARAPAVLLESGDFLTSESGLVLLTEE
jgi:hypothetical protein